MLDAALIQQIADTAKMAVIIEWRRQGHELTGKAASTIEYEVEQKAGETNIRFYIQDYMANINEGIPANRIPYSPGSGASFSKFIAGLTRYAKLRFGANIKEAEEIAHRIAKGALKTGLPGPGSKRFSSTGRRTGFIEQGLEGEEEKIGVLVERAVEETFRTLIESFFKSQISGR